MTAPSGARVVEQGISEREWARILQRIEGGKVIPVIGEHLSAMTGAAPPADTSLANYLASKLEGVAPPVASLNELVFRYLQHHPRGLDDLYGDIFQALPIPDAVPLFQKALHLQMIEKGFTVYVDAAQAGKIALLAGG